MVMGTGSRAGKSIVVSGLCRAASSLGLRVAPFKGIAVVNLRDVRNRSVGEASAGVERHVRAARLQFETSMNPVVVWPIGIMRGRLYLEGHDEGVVDLLNQDMVDTRSLSLALFEKIKSVVTDSLMETMAKYEAVIIEGASCPVDLPPQKDIANILVARLAQAPIVLCGEVWSGGAGAGLSGTGLGLPEDVRALLTGFVLSNVWDTMNYSSIKEFIESMLGVKLLGIVPHLDLWDGPLETHPSEDQEYDAWAGVVKGMSSKGNATLLRTLGLN